MCRRDSRLVLLAMNVILLAQLLSGSPTFEEADEARIVLSKKLWKANQFGLAKASSNSTDLPVFNDTAVAIVVKPQDKSDDSQEGYQKDGTRDVNLGRLEERPSNNNNMVDVNSVVFTLNPLPAGTTLSVDAGVSAVIVVPKGLIPGIDPDMPFVLRVYRTVSANAPNEKKITRAMPIPLPSVLIPILPGTAQIVVFPDGTVKQNGEFTGIPVHVDGAVVGV